MEVNEIKKIKFMPLIYIDPLDYAKESEEPDDSSDKEMNKYWYKCLKESGIEDLELFFRENVELKSFMKSKILQQYFTKFMEFIYDVDDLDEYDSLDGGFALQINDNEIFFPEHGELSDFSEWKEAYNDNNKEWKDLMVGLPFAEYRHDGNYMEFLLENEDNEDDEDDEDENDENDENDEIKILRIEKVLISDGLKEIEVELYRFKIIIANLLKELIPKSIFTKVVFKIIYGESLEYYEKITEILPPSYELFLERGNYFALVEKYEDAVVDFTNAIKLKPDDFQIYSLRAAIYLELHHDEKALSDISKAIELNSDDYELYTLKGAINTDMNDFDGAVDAFSKAIELNSETDDVFFNRALLYFKYDKMKEAILDISKAILIEPGYSDYYQNRGLMYEKLGKNVEASKDYESAKKYSQIENDDLLKEIYLSHVFDIFDIDEYEDDNDDDDDI
jgi:Flp pilus assembly protein TadD